MIEAIEKNLNRGIRLLNSITDAEYSNNTIPPYFSSIGTNIRHVLDAFDCIFNGLEKKQVDFSDRARNEAAEKFTADGISYFNDVITKLQQLKDTDFDMIITVCDDLGTGVVTANYTLGSALIHAHSHAIHHYASIGFIICQLGIELPDADFGYNPTTPKKTTLN